MRNVFFLLSCLVLFSCRQPISTDFNNKLIKEKWNACWIAPKAGLKEYGVYHFRKTFLLNDKPAHFIIHVSADNRYVLYINGQRVSHGPATGDIRHWQFETLDIAAFLKKDSNVIAAVVWNYGKDKPGGQLSIQTAFILQGNSQAEDIINTSSSWKVMASTAYSPCVPNKYEFDYSNGTGAYEKIDFSKYAWGWNQCGFDDSKWADAVKIAHGSMQPADSLWTLVQRQVPAMEYSPERFKNVVWCKGTESAPFIDGSHPLTIPANSHVSILLDKGHITTAFTELIMSGGNRSSVKITYAESMYDDTTRVLHGNSYKKGNRSETKGKFMLGLFDVIYPDGGKNRVFQPLAYRTYRFVQFDITTKEDALVIDDYKENFTAYPFELKASFSCDDTVLNQLFLNGWRSVRLCSHETYTDCPYYEQLQYFGDLNVTSRVSSYLSGDMRLVKQALLDGFYSMEGNELVLDAYPQTSKIIIPSFAISWIDIIGLYGAYTADTDFISIMMPGIFKVMNWYESKVDTTCYLLGPMPHWNFIDCTPQWPWRGQIDGSCEPPGTKEGHSAALTLQYLYGLQKAETLFANMGDIAQAAKYHSLAEKVEQALVKICWDEERSLFADIPDKNSYSQHANYLALATGIVPESKLDEFLKHLYYDKDLVQASLQFKAYLHMGLKKYDRIDNYTELINPWRELIKLGCTTFPEYPSEDNRSETHAWTTFPVLEMVTIVGGIQPQGLGFSSILIEPHLGNLQWVDASLPCKDGLIKVHFNKTGDGISGIIELPEKLSGVFKFRNKTIDLHPGKQSVQL
jgi:alpha-L-rhamnosidase